MTACRFMHTSTIEVDIPIAREWWLPIMGRWGQVSFTLPHSSPAASDDYIDPRGLSRIRLEDDAGVWHGVIMSIINSDSGIEVVAYQSQKLLAHLPVPLNTPIRNVSSGYIASRVLQQADGAGGLWMGTRWYDHGTHVTEYTPTGYVWDVILDMMGRSESELWIDAETLRMDWAGPFANASVYDDLLIAGVDLLGARWHVNAEDRVALVIGSGPDTEQYRQHVGDTAAVGWPAGALVSAGALADLVPAVNRELSMRSQSTELIDGPVTTDRRDIREGQFLRVLVPWARFTGVLVTARVMGRSDTPGSDRQTLYLQSVSDDTTTPHLPIPAIGGRPSTPLVQRSKYTERQLRQLQRLTRGL